MFRYRECIPDQYISESSVTPQYWGYLNAIKESHLDQEVFEASLALDFPVDMVEELYQGQPDSNEDFVY
jgi:hypothetical protein